jgi:hypothetical protein
MALISAIAIARSATSLTARHDTALDLQAARNHLVVIGFNSTGLDVCFDPHCNFLL